MGRPKPGADIEIGNQRRTPAIRRRQTEAEEQKMQHNKGRTKGLREGRSESIRMETGRRVVEWFAIFNQKRKIEQCKGERSCPLFSGNPPPHMSKKRERGRKNNHFTLAHEVAGLASAYSLSINKMRNGGERKRSLLKRLCTRNRTNADPEEWVWAFEKMNMQRVRADGDSRTGKSGTRHLLNKTKNKAIPCPREKLVMIAMNAALEDVYKKVFADSYQHGTDSEKEEAWHEIGGGRISDSELLDSMDGGRALQLKHEINVESTIIQRGTTKRDRDQPLVYRVPNLRFFKYPIPEEFQPLLPLGRVSLLSELAGREDQLINMNLESGWLIAASLYWRLSGRGGACYRNLFPGRPLSFSLVSKLAESQDIKSGKFLVGFSSSLSNRGKEDLHSFHSFSARGEARPTTNEGGKLALLAVALFLGLEHGSFIHLLMNSQLRQKQRRGGPRPGKGRVAEWSKAADCKSVEVFLRRFESCLSHLFVVDFREEKRGIRQRRKANRAKLLWPFREVQLYRMLVREVGELLRSIDSPSISNPNENRSE
ncbi:hypothetical protein Tco_1430109 [Tanacetum coccineum]